MEHLAGMLRMADRADQPHARLRARGASPQIELPQAVRQRRYCLRDGADRAVADLVVAQVDVGDGQGE